MDRRLAVLLLVYWFGQTALCLPVNSNLNGRSGDSLTLEKTEYTPVDVSEQARDSSSVLDLGRTDELFRSINIDSGMIVGTISLEINPNINAGIFQGRCTIAFSITNQVPEIFLAGDGFEEIQVMLLAGAAEMPVEVDDGGDLIVVTRPEAEFQSGFNYVMTINYQAELRNDGVGVYMGSYGANTYIGVNPYPDHISKIMPYPADAALRTFFQLSVNNPAGFSVPVSNVPVEGGNPVEFEVTQLLASHSFGAVIHNMQTLFAPEHIQLIGRNNMGSQVSYAAIMSGLIMENMGMITGREFQDIIEGNNLNIFALPDVVRVSSMASIVTIWEPNLMIPEVGFAEIHKETVLKTLATEMTKQWFHILISPSNMQYAWVGYGLSGYYGYVVADQADEELNVADHFLVDIMQAALLLDSQPGVEQMRPDEPLSIDDNADDILQGTMRLRAPAIISMVENIIGREALDESVAHMLRNSFTVFSDTTFYAAVNDFHEVEDMIGIQTVTDSYVYTNGYPVLTVEMSDTMEISVSQQKFGLEGTSNDEFVIPLSWATKSNPNFDETGPRMLMDENFMGGLEQLNFEEDEWIIFNIQQKGYYRVNYDEELWERLINTLSDEEMRGDIHRVNRAQLVDDAMNLARAGVLDYGVAIEVLSAMLVEDDYLVWRAAAPSLRFLRSSLGGEEDGPDLYRAYIRSLTSTVLETVSEFEDNLSHEENLLRALIYELSCEAESGVCLDYAHSYEDLNEVPAAHRPAVFCTIVRDAGDDMDVMESMFIMYQQEDVLHEKLVILKALGCSGDEEWINTYLERTVQDGNMLVAEKGHAFKGIIEGHENNVEPAFQFLQNNLEEIMNEFGGEWFVGEILSVLGEFIAETGMSNTYTQWLNNNEMVLGAPVGKVREYVRMTRTWRNNNLDGVKEVIQEAIDQLPSSANTFGASILLACVVTFIARFV